MLRLQYSSIVRGSQQVSVVQFHWLTAGFYMEIILVLKKAYRAVHDPLSSILQQELSLVSTGHQDAHLNLDLKDAYLDILIFPGHNFQGQHFQ